MGARIGASAALPKLAGDDRQPRSMRLARGDRLDDAFEEDLELARRAELAAESP